MKHAFLIIAHNEYPVLEVLLSMLDDERNDIYLHIDKRATELFQQIKKVKMQKAGFYLIENPIKVYWGDISQVQVEYLLFETALSHGPYAYYHLLSGTDLPIKSQDYIHAFFQQNAGKEFVGFWQDAAHQRDLERKVFRYYFFTKRLKDKEHLLHGITALIRNLILAVQKISHYRRKQTFEFKKGGNWISITENAVKYLLQYKEIVLNRMKYTLCADEIFKPPPAAQFVLTGVDQDPGDPGLEKRRRLQLFQFPQRPVHRLVHRLKGVGLAAQIQIRRAVQPGLDGFRPVGKLLLIHRDRLISALFCLLDGDVPRFVFTKENFFKKTGGASALPVVTLLGAPSGRRP